MKRLILLLAVVIGLLGGAGAAQASTVTGPPELQTQYVEAVEWWGQMPTGCRTVALSYEPVNPTEGGHAIIPVGTDECGIAVAEGQRSCAETEVMRHEVGHLLGYGHSEDPADVMYNGEGKLWTLCEVEAEARILGSYERWIKREVRRCRHREIRRKECFAGLQGIREELQARRAALAARASR